MLSDNNHINLGNYEEFFILYMDNELSPEQAQMVEAFLEAHPDLRAELDLLMGTKIEAETFSFDKSALYSENISLQSAETDLLLYIDNELPEDRKKLLEFELKENPAYALQHQALARTRLDANETIAYPDKKELYRYETRRAGLFRPWMRIAAAVILIASSAALYFNQDNKGTDPGNISGHSAVAGVPPVKDPAGSPDSQSTAQEKKGTSSPGESLQTADNTITIQKQPVDNNLASTTVPVNNQSAGKPTKNDQDINPGGIVEPYEPVISYAREERIASIETHKENLNRTVVTQQYVEPYNQLTAAIQPAVYMEDAAKTNDSRKGSFKGLLRKASRFVERTTGIDPSNGDDELLIGAVALKLK